MDDILTLEVRQFLKEARSQAAAAEYVDRKPQRVLQWRQREDMIGFFVGDRWFISREELEAFMAKPRRKAGAPRGPRKSA